MKKIYMCIISLIGLNFSAQTQITLPPARIKAPNTDAVSVFNFTESPVSLNTGLVDVSYPVYEIKTNGLTIPITLSYFSRGVRVEDIASSVGLGWSLNYGGMVSREIREGADELGNYSYLYNNIYDNFFSSNVKRNSVLATMSSIAGSENSVDFIPDQFYFSLADYSGKFILDWHDKKALQQTFTDIKIEPDWTGGPVLHSWVITDTKGNKYYYGRNPETNADYVSYVLGRNFRQIHPASAYAELDQDANLNPDTWYLQKIITSTSEVIKYNYVHHTTQYYKKKYDQRISPCLHPCDNPPDAGKIYTYYSLVDESKFALESIEFPEGKLQFVLNTADRQDVLQGNALEKIIVYDKQNKIIQSHQLTYDYVDAITNNARTNVMLTQLDPSSKKRMFLKEIKKVTVENDAAVLVAKTKYNYNPERLPDRFSTAKDLWGYYNNKSNGTFDHFYDYQGIITNRNTDETASKAGILTSIDLPTGEKRVFTYENNILRSPYFNFNQIIGYSSTDDFGNKYGPGLRIQAIEYRDGGEVKMKKSYEYTDDAGNNSGRLFGMREYMAILGYKSFMQGAAPIPVIDPNGVLAGNVNSALESRNFGYSYVKEYFGDQFTNKGKIDYIFTNHPDTWNFAEYPFHLASDNSWTRGLLLEQKYYEKKNSGYELQKEIKNSYKIGGYDHDNITGLVGPLPGFALASPSVFNYEKTNYLYKMPLAKLYIDNRMPDLVQPQLNSPYLIFANTGIGYYWYYKPFNFTGGRIEKYETVVTDHTAGSEMVSQTNFTYPSYSNNVSKVKSKDSDGGILETSYSYAQEKGNQLMIGKNMVGVPLETTLVKKKDDQDAGKVLSKSETVYPVSQSEADTKTAGLVLPYEVKSTDLLNISAKEITYDRYDTKGNLLQYTKKDGSTVGIVWGYNKSLPIATIEGKDAALFMGMLDTDILVLSNASNNDVSPATEEQFRLKLDAFQKRQFILAVSITTYTHNPLIGVTSITPPSGIREIYQYDSANRLEKVIDVNGKVLKEFKYNIKN